MPLNTIFIFLLFWERRKNISGKFVGIYQTNPLKSLSPEAVYVETAKKDRNVV